MLVAWVGSKKKGRLKKVCVFSKGEEVAAWVKKVKKLRKILMTHSLPRTLRTLKSKIVFAFLAASNQLEAKKFFWTTSLSSSD